MLLMSCISTSSTLKPAPMVAIHDDHVNLLKNFLEKAGCVARGRALSFIAPMFFRGFELIERNEDSDEVAYCFSMCFSCFIRLLRTIS